MENLIAVVSIERARVDRWMVYSQKQNAANVP